MLQIYVRHAKIGDKVHGKNSLYKLNGWKNIKKLILKKEIKQEMSVKRTSINYSKTHFMARQCKKLEVD